MLRALEVAALTVPAGLAHADARVHGLLLAMHTWDLASGAHPALLTRLARGLTRCRCVAIAAVVAVWCSGAVWYLTPNACPTGRADTLWNGSVTLAAARAVKTKQARTARHFAQGALVAKLKRAFTSAVLINDATVVAALCVAARAGPARVTLAVARVWRRLRAMHARVIARGAHPGASAVLTPRDLERVVAEPATKAVGRAGAVWCLAAWACPSWLTIAGNSASITLAVA